MNPQFFITPSQLREWFETNHHQATELWVGYYKRSSGKKSITWPESVEQAICFGWIDGIRKSVDEFSYTIRFTPRHPKSTWSLKNINTAEKLIREKKMHAGGLRAFENRKVENSGIYSYEQENHVFPEDFELKIKGNPKAWSFFSSQPPYYRKTVIRWIMSAKQEKTRVKRLAELISDSENGLRIRAMRR